MVCSSFYGNTFYLSLSCSPVLRVVWNGGVESVSSSVEIPTMTFLCWTAAPPLLPFLLLCVFKFVLTSVHIGRPPECCVSSRRIPLYCHFIADEYADVLILGYVVCTLCQRRWCVCVCACRREEFVCVCTVWTLWKSSNPQRSLHPSHWIQMCHYLYVSPILTCWTHTRTHTHNYIHIVQDQKCAMMKWTLDNLFFLCYQRRAK